VYSGVTLTSVERLESGAMEHSVPAERCDGRATRIWGEVRGTPSRPGRDYTEKTQTEPRLVAIARNEN